MMLGSAFQNELPKLADVVRAGRHSMTTAPSSVADDPLPEFHDLSEAEVHQALANADPAVGEKIVRLARL